MDGGSNFLSQSELSAHIGLGSAAAADEVRVTWPNGQVTTLTNLASGRHVVTPPTTNTGCGPADVAEPYDVLDLADVQGFIAAFTTQGDAADIAEPFGVFDLADLQGFVAAFLAGCP